MKLEVITELTGPQIWAATWQNQQNECAPSEDSDQPGHPPSPIRVLAVRMKKPWVFSYPLSAQQRLWSDWANAQAGLSLHWAHSHIVGFVMSLLKFEMCGFIMMQWVQEMQMEWQTVWNQVTLLTWRKDLIWIWPVCLNTLDNCSTFKWGDRIYMYKVRPKKINVLFPETSQYF